MYRENNLVFIFLFLYTFLEDVNHDTYLNDIKQVFYIMNNVIALYIEIGGNVIKIFYHVELIMINYLDKLTTHPSPECLEFVRCFCSILLNPKFYYEENFDKIENFFCSLQNTITNPNEFLTESMLIQVCNLSEQIFPYEKEKPFLIQSYYTLLTHLLSDNTSSNRNSNSNDNNNSNINRFFSIILDHMKKLGFDEQAYDDNSNNNDNGVLGKQDELILISNENDFDDMAAASTPFGEPEQPCLTSSLLTVYHFIKVLHISNYISRLSQKNKKYITSSFLFYFRHYLSKDNASELQQKTAKLLVIIMFDYYIKLNPSKENNKILRDNISKLNFTPMLAETIISTAIAATSLDDKLAFSKHTTLLSFNTSEIPHTQVIYLFQLICYIMCRNFHALQRERGMKLFNDFIDTYDLLKRCFDSVLQIHTSNIFYIDFFSESWGFMVKLYEFYFRVFLEGEEIFENEYESFHSGRSPFCLLDDNNNNNNSYKRKHMYIDFKHKLVNDFLEISAKLALGHINPFTHKVIYLLFTKGKEDNMQDFFELLTSTMEFYIKNVTVSSSYRKYYLINLLSFYSKLNLLLITKSKISEHLYKRNTELCCKFFGLFKETTLIYSLIGVEIGQTVKLISEAIFDNYIEMYLANTDNPDERVRKLIVDELDAMIFCDPTNLDKPVSTPIKRLSFNYDSDDTNIHNDNNNNNTHRSEFSATMCLLIERKINSAVLKTLDDIVDSIVNEKKYNILRDVHVSVFFLTKTVLQAYVLGNNCLPLLEKIRKLSKYLIKEVIHTQNMKLTQSKHGLYNKFVSILKERIKMKAQQRYDEVYALMLEACKQYYHNTAQCQEDITIFRAFDLNKTVWRTPGRRLSKNYGNGNGNGMQHMLLSPPQSFKSNLSADDNSNHNHHGNKQGNNYSTTSLPSLRTHSSPKDEIMTRTMSWHFEQDYGSNSESNDFGDLFLEVQEGDSKDNKEEKKENGSSSSKGSWLSIFKWRKNSTSVEQQQQQQIVRSNNNDNDKQKQQRKIEECDFLFEELLMDFNPVNKSKQRVKHDKKPTPKPFTQLNHKWSLTNPKTQLLKSHFALAFKHVYFHSDTFIHMKHAYFTYTNLPSLNKASKQLNFPSKIKNFSNTTEPPLFLKYDKHFFTNKYFPISHSYVKKPRSLLHERTIPFITTINTNNDEPPKYTFTCELINLDKSIYGNIHLYKHYLIFISNTNDPRCDNNDPKVKLNFIFGSIKNDRITTNNKTCLMFYYEIKEILIRRFLFLWQSIEIFHKNGKSYFINFFSETTCNEFFVALQQTLPSKSKTLITNNTKDIIAIVMDYQKKWIEKRISTYQYLLYINKYSSRSYKDVNQYPILPWLLKKSERIFDVNFGSFSRNNKQKDNNDKKEHVNRSYELCLVKEEKTFINTVDACNKQKNNFRELHYPISMQNEDKRMIAMIRYEESKREEKFAYHLGTFYSTASYVFYYLMRLGPFMRSLIKLQNGAQENPNRMFDSLKDTQEILDNSTDNRELIPEFFACVEFLLNLNCSFFGVKYGNKVVDDVTFQHGNSLAKYIQFVLAHRKLLNSTRISSHIRCWIDYTYGVNQLSSDATSCTVFSVNSYAQKVKLNDKLMKMKHKSAKYNNGVIDYASVYNKMNDKVLIILNFGQAPFQVFTSKHPNRNEHQSGNDDEYDDDKGHQTNSENTLVDDYELLGKLIHYISQKIKVKGVSDIVCGRYYVHSASYDKMCFITCNGVIAVCKEIPLRQTYENDNVDVYKLQGFHLENPKQMKRLLQLNETVMLPEWSFCMLNEFSICVTCGYLSNAICITRLKENNVHDSTYIIMEDFVRAVCKITETTFMIGLNSGKLIEHKLSFTNNNNNNVKSTIPERCIQAHLSSISIIEYIPRLDIIVTVGDDNYIYIRKYFDFELLSVIKVNSNYKVLSVKISNVNCLYVLVYDQVKDGKNVMVVGYTLNGVEFARSECGMFTNMEVLENSNVVVGCCDETCQPAEQKRKGSHLHILKGSYLTMLGSLRIKKSEEMKLTFIKYNSVKKMLYCFFNEETKVFQVLNEDEDETVMFH